MTAVVCSPTIGLTPATKAKATASGIMASETVKPESVLRIVVSVDGGAQPGRVSTDWPRERAFATRSSSCDVRAGSAAAWARMEARAMCGCAVGRETSGARSESVTRASWSMWTAGSPRRGEIQWRTVGRDRDRR